MGQIRLLVVWAYVRFEQVSVEAVLVLLEVTFVVSDLRKTFFLPAMASVGTRKKKTNNR
jgi:hypothetical protein